MKKLISVLLSVFMLCSISFAEQAVVEDFTSISKTWLNTVPVTGDGAILYPIETGYPESYVHTQQGASLTISKVSSGSPYLYVCNVADAETKDKALLYYGWTDNANRDNSGAMFLFAPPADADVSNKLVHLDFKISTNVPGRTYAYFACDNACVYQIANAGSEFTAEVPKAFRMELDSRAGSLSAGAAAVLRMYIDGALVYTLTYQTYPANIGFALAAYKTPTMTISDLDFGYEESLVSENVWLNSLPGGGGEAGAQITEPVTHTQNGASVTVGGPVMIEGDKLISFVAKHTGNKLTYVCLSGGNNSNSWIPISVDAGTNNPKNPYNGTVKFLEFNVKTNAPTRTYMGLKSGDTIISYPFWADSTKDGLKNTGVNTIRAEIDTRPEALPEGANGSAISRVYANGELIDSIVLSNDSNIITIEMGGYESPVVEVTGLRYGEVKVDGGSVSDIELSGDNKTATVKIMNPVYRGVGGFGNALSLIIAGYDESGRLVDCLFESGVMVRGEQTLTKTLTTDKELSYVKAFLWNVSYLAPIATNADSRN